MSGAFPRRYQENRTTTKGIAEKNGSHCPIPLVLDSVGHRRRVRGEEQAPGPKRNGFRAALVLDGLRDLRDISQKAKTVEKREHCKSDVCDRHAADSVIDHPAACATAAPQALHPCCSALAGNVELHSFSEQRGNPVRLI
jgi:hypothetical protein